MECEIYAEVTVSGPATQLETYMKWLSKTPECVYGVKRKDFQSHIPLELTPKDITPISWEFASSNIKTKIKVATLRPRNKLNFTINYAILNDTKINDMLNFKDIYQTQMYEQLIGGFDPLPEPIRSQCESLTYDITWGSYFIEDKLLVMKASDAPWSLDYL